MAGYLASYGAGDEQRNRRVKRMVIWGVAILVVGTAGYFFFRNWQQERTVKQFFSLLQQQRYQDAYAMFGCTQEHPCKYYSPEKFNEDWGPSSPYANPGGIKIQHEDTCGNGVVFDIELPGTPAQGLFVNRETNELSFAEGPRCPGPHLQLWEFLKAHFG
jgi:hypothetical protein